MGDWKKGAGVRVMNLTEQPYHKRHEDFSEAIQFEFITKYGLLVIIAAADSLPSSFLTGCSSPGPLLHRSQTLAA